MRMSRLLVTSLFVGSVLAACGGDDGGGGGGGGGVDAAPMIDAPMIDAGNAAATGLGAVCTQTVACPTTPAGLECIALSQTATSGFCTLSCGTTASTATEPPAGGDAICMGSMPAPGAGTPACVLSGTQGANKIWMCGILCGTLQGTDLGSCPGGLTCTDNLCQ